MNAFVRRPRADAAWHFVGPASVFPDLGPDSAGTRIAPRCRAFTIPKPDGLDNEPPPPAEVDIDLPGDLGDQVLVFRYKGGFHAVDHVREMPPPAARPGLMPPSNALTPPSPSPRAASSTLRTLASP